MAENVMQELASMGWAVTINQGFINRGFGRHEQPLFLDQFCE
jgi:hypothetical protein